MHQAHAGTAPTSCWQHYGLQQRFSQATAAHRVRQQDLRIYEFKCTRSTGGPQRRIRPPRFTQDSASTSAPLRMPAESPDDHRNWFARCVGIIGGGALVSKALGLVREQLVSTSLGLGGLADAFNLASTFPVLCLTGIGGLNGALHSATASICGSREVAHTEGASQGCVMTQHAIATGIRSPSYIVEACLQMAERDGLPAGTRCP